MGQRQPNDDILDELEQVFKHFSGVAIRQIGDVPAAGTIASELTSAYATMQLREAVRYK